MYELFGDIWIRQMPYNNSYAQCRQKINKFSPGRSKAEIAEQIAGERGCIAEKEKNKTGGAKHFCRHVCIGEIDQKWRATHSGGNGSEAGKYAGDHGVAWLLRNLSVRCLHENQRQKNQQIDKQLQGAAVHRVENPKAKWLSKQNPEIEPKYQRAVDVFYIHQTLNKIPAAGQQQHDWDHDFNIIK